MSEESGIDALSLPTAGHVAIRGGIVRLVGYGVGTLLGTATAVLLLRYLGVRNYGHYATVVAIAGVLSAASDPGFSAVGEREYVVATSRERRRDLLAVIVGMRLALTPIALALGVAFAAVAGYGWTIVAGAAIAGLGVGFTLLANVLMIPANAAMRFTTVTVQGLARDGTAAIVLVVLVVLGAGLVPIFTATTIGALVALLVSAFVAGRHAMRAHFSLPAWKPIAVEALPLGVATLIGAVYLRALLIVTSLVAPGIPTGLYAMSDRIVQVLVGAAAVGVSASFPILFRAGGDDRGERLAYVMQQLFDVAIFCAVLGVLIFAIAARPIVILLGGPSYAGSAPILRLQCFALFGSFLSAVWLPALFATRNQRSFIFVNLTGLASVTIIGGILIPEFGVKGTAIAAAVGEASIALAALVALIRVRPALRPRLGASLKLLAAAPVCGAVVFIPGVPAVAAAVIAVTSYVAVTWLLGAVPRDPVEAILARRRQH